MSTRTSFVVRVDYVTEWEGDDLQEARRQYESALAEAYVDEDVVLQLVVHSVIDIRDGVGSKPWPRMDPNIKPGPIMLPKVSVVRGGIEYKRSNS